MLMWMPMPTMRAIPSNTTNKTIVPCHTHITIRNKQSKVGKLLCPDLSAVPKSVTIPTVDIMTAIMMTTMQASVRFIHLN